MDWIKVSIFTKNTGIDAVLGILLDFGIESTQVCDEDEFSSFLEENRKSWDYVDDDLLKQMSEETHIDFYVKPEEFGVLDKIKSELISLKATDTNDLYGKLELSFENLEGEDWLNSWKKHFHTFTISDKLIIKPYWEHIENTGKKVFEINPGMSFGTGTHHTTKMCLEDIVNIVNLDDSVLDLGSGSGILSIVSLLFGAKDAVSVDIDENSLKTISENLKRNNIDEDKCKIFIGNIIEDFDLQNKILQKQYDIVLANIVADVIIAILPLVKRAIKPDGIFIASGIIEDRISEVKEKLTSEGFAIISEKRSADWAEFMCRL